MQSFSFSKNQRLLTPADYQYVFKKAVRSSDKYFTIIARKGSSDRSRLGLAISKKSVKLAVQRNRIKRLTREFFRQNFLSNPSVDFVVMAKKGIDQVSNEILYDSLNRNFSRLYHKL